VASPSTGVIAVMARLIVDWETPYVSASSCWTRFPRKYVSVTTTHRNKPRLGGHVVFFRRADSRLTARAQVRDLLAGEAGGIVHLDGPFLENCVW